YSNNKLRPNLNDSFNRSLEYSDIAPNKNHYTLHEIIPEKVFKDLEKSIIKETALKNRLGKVNEENMRVPFRHHKDVLEDIKRKAEKKIRADKINLIHYLNKK